MSTLPRQVVPEILDELAADDPRAQRSRRELRTVHSFMRSPAILGRLLGRLEPLERSAWRQRSAWPPSPVRLIELGAGDGTLLLRAAGRLSRREVQVELTLLDRVELLSDATREGYARLGWRVSSLRADALAWAREAAPAAQGPASRHDACIVSLFLHHFADPDLRALLAGIACRADALIGIEPRRSALARLGARCIGVIGAGEVTRSDSLTSVEAGFRGRELTQAWQAAVGGAAAEWQVEEFSALPFTHCFLARRLASCARVD